MKSEKVEEAWKNFLALAERLPLGVQAEVGHLARLLVDAEVKAERERLAAAGACTMAPKSLFVVIEGVDRVGKNTQADLLARRLNLAGERTCKFTTPDYYTASGDLVGRYLQGKVGLCGEGPAGDAPGQPQSMRILVDNARTLNSLMIVNRYEVASEIRGRLLLGEHVVCVRWWPSPYLYGKEEGLDGEPILEACAHLPEPDLYVLLDAEVSSIASLLDQGSRYEARLEVQEGLASAYRKLWAIPPDALSSRRPPLAAGERPGAWAIVQASASPGEVHERVWRAVLGARPELGTASPSRSSEEDDLVFPYGWSRASAAEGSSCSCDACGGKPVVALSRLSKLCEGCFRREHPRMPGVVDQGVPVLPGSENKGAR